MSFQQGLSGLNGAAKSLDVIGNNIANSSTVGFKGSTTEFADVYARSLNGAGATQAGIGVSVAAIAQQFTQGNIETTANPLQLWGALQMAALFQAVLMVVYVVRERWGTSGVMVTAAVAAATVVLDSVAAAGAGTRSTTPPNAGSAGGVGRAISCKACLGAVSALLLATGTSGVVGFGVDVGGGASVSVSAVSLAASCTKT